MTGFNGRDAVINDQTDRDFAQSHPDHFADADRSVCDPGAEPEPKEIKEHDRENEGDDPQRCYADEIKRFHTTQS